MCSVGDDFQEDAVENYMKGVDVIKTKTCNKCREAKATVLLRHKDGYCKTCFLNGTKHKFKAFLGKHRFIKKNDHVLINYSHGHAATSLLSFLNVGFHSATAKQLTFTPLVVYIERNYHLNIEERMNVLKQIDEQVKQFNFKIYYVSFLQYILSMEVEVKTNYKDLKLNKNDGNKITEVYSNSLNHTMELEVYKQLEYQLLLNTAKELQCQHIFACDIAINIASEILTNVSLGRGSHLQMDVGICDTRDQDVTIIKPLRFFDSKELALYNFYQNIHPVVIKESEKDPYLSVQQLMNHFVQNLQINFPATINTVIKTSDKLGTDKEIWANERCKLCLLPIESQQTKLTSAEATEFSHWLSTYKSDHKLDPVESYNQALAEFKRKPQKYCFSCSKISDYLIKDQV